MPTILRMGPYRFFFYANDRYEPKHVHVRRDEKEAKFWLEPVRLERTDRFRGHELRRIESLIELHADLLRWMWDEFFEG
jgi:hypothetical protein